MEPRAVTNAKYDFNVCFDQRAVVSSVPISVIQAFRLYACNAASTAIGDAVSMRFELPVTVLGFNRWMQQIG